MKQITNKEYEEWQKYKVEKDWQGYALPGEHVEPGESFVDAVIREMKEETGLKMRSWRKSQLYQKKQDCPRQQLTILSGRFALQRILKFVLLYPIAKDVRCMSIAIIPDAVQHEREKINRADSLLKR